MQIKVIVFTVTLSAFFLSGFLTEATIRSAAADKDFISGVKITKPGVVAVDAPARRIELTDANALDLCAATSNVCSDHPDACEPTSKDSPPKILHKVKGPDGYGLDYRYLSFHAFYREAGSACLQGDNAACKGIQKFTLKWARDSKLGRPTGGKDDSRFWNDTLSVNMYLLGPMISALSVAEQFSPLATSDRESIDKWLKRKVKQYRHGMRHEGRYNGGKHGTTARKAAHNHAVQSSIAAMSYGAWVNDKKHFKTGIEQWFITLESMRKDGSLPIETRRGARALMYTDKTLSGLMQLAERAAVQGINLFEAAPSPSKTIHQAVKFFIDAVEKPDIVLKYAKTNRHPGPSKNYKKQELRKTHAAFGWMASYMSRFPDHSNTRRLLARKSTEHSETKSYLTPQLDDAVRAKANPSIFVSVDTTCFYADPELA